MRNSDSLADLRRRIDETEARHTRELEALRAAVAMLEAAESLHHAPPPLPRKPTPAEDPEVQPPAAPPAPSNVRAFRRSAPEPAPEWPPEPPPEPPPAEREIDFGRVWLVRAGVVILLTGLVFLGNYAYQNWIRELPNGARLAALAALAFGMVETGRRLAMREHLRRFGEVVMAGGLGFAYYCAYAAHHVERLRVIDNVVAAGALLVAAAIGIGAVAWLRQSRATATLGVLLASYTTVVQPLGWLACVSNSALAAMGLFFLTRRGWAAPGWVSMLGMYAAFLLWQVLGAAGRGGAEAAALWFLPPAWLLFAAAGVSRHAGLALGDRARAWFAGANNALFFGLFSAMWLHHHGSDHYWRVAGVLAVALIAFGIAGRRAVPVAGAVNLSQGLLLLGLAMVLKLEGFHLGLAFAAEALMLAVAYARFRGRVEAVFAVLAAMAAAIWIVDEPTKLWSAALAVLPLAAACIVMRRAAGFERRRDFHKPARAAAAAIFWCAWLVLAFGVILRLEGAWISPAVAAAAAGLGAAALGLDRKHRLRELTWGALAMLVFAITRLAVELAAGEVVVASCLGALAFHIAGAWLWRGEPRASHAHATNPIDDPRIPGWFHAMFAATMAWAALANTTWPEETRMIAMSAAGLGLVAAAGLAGAGRLAAAGGALALAAVFTGLDIRPFALEGSRGFFGMAGLALAALPLMAAPPMRGVIHGGTRQAAGALFRAAAALAWAIALQRSLDDHAIDGWAATAIVPVAIAATRKWKIPLESIAFLAIAVIGLLAAMADGPWSRSADPGGWRGIGVVVALLAVTCTWRERDAMITDAAVRMRVLAMLAVLACAITSLWSTQMVVWRAGWPGTVPLWSVLGFLAVSAGLWQRLRALRVCGLLLLVVALSKLFTHDVWDFTAFTRVVSFIVLGVALILLGLFYSHFATTLRKWL